MNAITRPTTVSAPDLQPTRRPVRRPAGRAAAGRRPAVRSLSRALAVALALQFSGANALQVTYTGAAPVYMASWYNGSTTEVHEFQFYLDWLGYCNAHFGSSCSSTTYFGSAQSWSGGTVPGAFDEAVISAGQTVVVGSLFSAYQGPIGGSVTTVGTVTSSGKVVIGNSLLSVTSGTFADLAFGGSGLQVSGGATVGLLSAGSGGFSGAGGTTTLQAVAAHQWSYGVGTGHTVIFTGSYTGDGLYGGHVALAPGATLENYGWLNNVNVNLNGAATASTVPRFVNHGQLLGDYDGTGVRLDNQGLVSVGNGQQALIGPSGVHTGTFAGTAGSQLVFNGPWGQTFQSGSQLTSAGLVWFKPNLTTTQIHGVVDVAQLQVSGAQVTIDGASTQVQSLTLDTSGNLSFTTPTAPQIGDVSVSTGTLRVATQDGSTTSFASLSFSGGALLVDTPVTVTGPLLWQSGALNNGSALLSANGGLSLTTSGDHVLYGQLANHGSATWSGGSFRLYSNATFLNAAGSTFDIQGDVGGFAAGPYGLFTNDGLLLKSAGSGWAQLSARVANTGTVQANSGTLYVVGGLNQLGGQLVAAPGAALVFGGDNTLNGTVASSGAVSFQGSSLTLNPLARFVNPNAGVQVSSLTVSSGALLSVGQAVSAGYFTNEGTVQLAAGTGHSLYSLYNVGQLNASGDLSTNTVNNGGILNTAAGFTASGLVSNSGLWTNGGHAGLSAGLDQSGTLTNLGGAEFNASGPVSVTGHIVNQGSFNNFGTATLLGTLSNAAGATTSNWSSFEVAAGGSVTNLGQLQNHGTFAIAAGGQVGGSGSYTQDAGVTQVNGTLQAPLVTIADGVLKGTGTVVGDLVLGATAQWQPGNSPGTFSVVGNVTVNGLAGLAPGSGNLAIELASTTVFDRVQVSGAVSFSDATLDVVVLPGYAPTDGDTFAWLGAGSVNAPTGTFTVNLTGISDWQALPTFSSTGASLELMYVGGTPIDTSMTSYAVAVGDHQYLASFDAATYDALDIAGYLSVRPEAWLQANTVTVQSGGQLVNRGQANLYNLSNYGTVLNLAAGQMSVSSLENLGSLRNTGSLQAYALTNHAGASVENGGSLLLGGPLNNDGDFTVAGSLTSSYGFVTAYGGAIVNRGQFTVAKGGSVTSAGSYYQRDDGLATGSNGPLTQVDGTLQAPVITIQDGTLAGSGHVVGDTILGSYFALGSGPTVDLGTAGSTLHIDGNLQAYGGFFNVTLGSGGNGVLAVSGAATFAGGKVSFILPAAPDGTPLYMPQAGDTFTWLLAGGGISGLTNLSWELDVVSSGSLGVLASGMVGDPAVAYGGLWISSTGDSISFAAAPVPEPTTWGLMLSGLMVLAWRGRRRRQDD